MNIVKTKNFQNYLFDLLKDFNNKEFNLMIAGGSLLKVLSDERFSSLKTSKWNIFYADERCNKNYLNFEDSRNFLNKTSANVHKIEIFSNPEESKIKYGRQLEGKLMDLCLLGIGENGHICSLWPNSKSLESTEFVEFVTVDCPFSPERITVTLKFLNLNVKRLFFVVPPKNGIPKKIQEPHESILKKLTSDFTILLFDESK